MSKKEYAVVIIDMSYTDKPGGDLRIRGFPSFDTAREYARRRTRDSVEALRTFRMKPEALRQQWYLYGEDAMVLGGDEGETYAGADELDFFIAHRAKRRERNWERYGRDFPLTHEG